MIEARHCSCVVSAAAARQWRNVAPTVVHSQFVSRPTGAWRALHGLGLSLALLGNAQPIAFPSPGRPM